MRLRPEQIRHIPRLLYHWRMVTGSLADQPDAKPQARHAARRALNSHLQERGIAARAEACPENPESHRVVYSLPAVRPGVTILRPAREGADSGSNAIIRSWNGSLPRRGQQPRNAIAQKARGEILLFLSNGISATEPGWLTEIVSQIVRPEVGAVGARLWSPEGTLEGSGLILGLGGIAAPAWRGSPRGHPGYFNRAWLQQNLSAVSGACLAIRRAVFQQLGGFDHENLPDHFYDVDLCLRLREHGLQVIWTPYASLRLAPSHAEEAATSFAEADYMKKRWGPLLRHDPFYNPNLSLEQPGFVLAVPPGLTTLMAKDGPGHDRERGADSPWAMR